jgi:hypothetical protein
MWNQARLEIDFVRKKVKDSLAGQRANNKQSIESYFWSKEQYWTRVGRKVGDQQ